MSARLIKQPSTLAYSGIRIYFDPDYQEYSVRVIGNKLCSYYTSDKQDAIQTAQVMRNSIFNGKGQYHAR